LQHLTLFPYPSRISIKNHLKEEAMNKERLVNVAWTVGAVVIGLALYDMFVKPHLPARTA
jgi:hypothetical protein